MFHTFIFEPVFNLLTAIYALIPGHNFGLAIVLFTLLIRMLMWPLVRKQLHHTKAMKELAPEVKRIKKETKGDVQKERLMVMELYKEKEVSPFAPFLILAIQLPILLALYSGLRKIIDDPQAIIDNSYAFIKNLPSMKELATNIKSFDMSLFGILDLKSPALGSAGVNGVALMLAVGSAVLQYFQTQQITPSTKESKKIRQILAESTSGEAYDPAEMNAAVMRNMRFIFPAMLLLITLSIASGLTLYIFVSGAVAYAQQAYLLAQDEKELVGNTVDVTEVEIVKTTKKLPKTTSKKVTSSPKKSVNKKKG